MQRFLTGILNRVVLLLMRMSIVGRFDGVALVDFRSRGDSFRETVEESLRLVRKHDVRRYARVIKHIRWIVNAVNNSLGAEYDSSIRSCTIEFFDVSDFPKDALAAMWACCLVHEATHGAIGSRGIKYNAQNRARIERLCVAEQNRFAARLAAVDPERYPKSLLHEEFDEASWKGEWNTSRLKRSLSYLSRCYADHKAERTASVTALTQNTAAEEPLKNR